MIVTLPPPTIVINPLSETVATSELPPVYVNAPLLFDVGGVISIVVFSLYVTDGIEKIPKDGMSNVPDENISELSLVPLPLVADIKKLYDLFSIRFFIVYVYPLVSDIK